MNLAEVRARANSLYWAGVFGQTEQSGMVQPASTRLASASPASTNGANSFDWSRVFPQRAALPRAVADPMRSGFAVAMEDVASPAIESAAASDTDAAPSAEDFGRDVSARVRDLPMPRGRALAEPMAKAPPSVVVMSDESWKAVRAINRDVNRQIRSASDERVYGAADYWAVPTGANARGDCEDYVLAKRRALIRAGYPVGALSIAIAETRWGEVHAVLLLATNEGDFVLDNLNSRVSRWDQVRYNWRERQAPGKTFEWVRMGA